MDDIALQTLRDEMRDDCRVVRDALDKAQARFARGEEVAYEQEFVTRVAREQQIEL